MSSVVLVVILVALFAPLQAAYACGVVVATEGAPEVEQERALIRWDGSTEDLVMEFTLQSASNEAAWIVPVPARAEVQLAHPQLFDTLQRLTKPRVERKRVWALPGPAMQTGTGGAQTGMEEGEAPSVTLLERQRLGPFEVSTLAAREATALHDWLQSHDYAVPSTLAAALAPYVAQDWLYVAIRLSPEAGAVLNGTLDPLWLRFASDQIIYPLRLASIAGRPLPVFLYVLAEHRAAIPPAYNATNGADSSLEVSYANWLNPETMVRDSALAELAPRRMFLTKFEGYLSPEQMRGDWIFPLDSRDETFHKVEYEYVYTDPFPFLCTAVLLLVVLGGLGTWVHGIIRRRQIRRWIEESNR